MDSYGIPLRHVYARAAGAALALAWTGLVWPGSANFCTGVDPLDALPAALAANGAGARWKPSGIFPLCGMSPAAAAVTLAEPVSAPALAAALGREPTLAGRTGGVVAGAAASMLASWAQ